MIVGGTPGEQVRMLRARAGMTAAQLAAAVQLSEERVNEIETDAADPGVAELQRLVAATGHRLFHGVTRELREPGAARAVEILHLAVSNLLAATIPLEPLPAIGLDSWRRGPLGLFLVARESVRSLLILDMLGHAHHPGPLTDRSVFEDVATAYWVAQVPAEREDRYRWLTQDRNYYLKLLSDLDAAGWSNRLETAHEEWAEAGEPPDEFTRRLPRFEERLAGAMEEWYVRYRGLSLHSHPNSERLEEGIRETDIGPIANVEVASDPRALAFAATLVWTLALQLEFDWGPNPRTGLGFQGEVEPFRELGLVLNSFTRGEPVKPDSLIYIPGPQDLGK